MPVMALLRLPSVRRRLLIVVVLAGCFVWAMVVVGLSFAMVEHGSGQWWIVPLFGAFVLGIAVVAVQRVAGPPARSDATPVEVVAPDVAPAPGRAVVTRELAERLSPREMQVLDQLAAGRSNAEIARALFVAPGTVKAHLNHIFRKLEAGSRLQAVAHAREAGLLD
jgi:DNA-binding CsgD family transcriptional regulator